MTLEDFISESIKQIIGGVKQAQIYAAKNGAHINPSGYIVINSSIGAIRDPYAKSYGQLIDFDIAVTTKDEKEVSGKAGLSITVFKTGIDGKHNNENVSTNRIKFSIPILLPTQTNKNE
jgi:hypothetical protein